MLEYNSFNSLRNELSAGNRTIRLELNLSQTGRAGSAVTRNALLVLRRAADRGGTRAGQEVQSSPIGLIRLYWT